MTSVKVETIIHPNGSKTIKKTTKKINVDGTISIFEESETFMPEQSSSGNGPFTAQQYPEFIEINFNCDDEVSALYPPTAFRTIKSIPDVEKTMRGAPVRSLKITKTSNFESEDSKCSFEKKSATSHSEPSINIITLDPTQSTTAWTIDGSHNPHQKKKSPAPQEKNCLKWSFVVLVVVIVVFLCILVTLLLQKEPDPSYPPTSTAPPTTKIKPFCSKTDGFELCFQKIEGCVAKGCSCKAWINDNGVPTNCKNCKLCDDGFSADCTYVLGDIGMFSCNTTKPPEQETKEMCDQNDKIKICMQYDEKCKTAGCNCVLWYEFPGTNEREQCKSCEFCETAFMADCTNTSIGDKHFCS